jgi:putative transposase
VKPDAGMHASLVEFEPEKLPHNEPRIGIDVGLEAFATLSDGTRIENHRYYKAAQAQLRRAHRKVARRPYKKSQRRHKAILVLQMAHQHVGNQRRDFQHKLTYWPVLNFGRIAVEDLNVKGLSAGFLAKAIHDCRVVFLPQKRKRSYAFCALVHLF